ncbi:MAG: fibronectin type III-like domain-contianing protein, partial [Blastocatellia bacterium]|nr:fibronectin type III-like domain-contianing protein [Blastocatellia bacterium]
EKYTSKYLDVPNTPLYPFGHGLSYTKFRLSNLQLDKDRILLNGTVRASVEIENVGKRTGDEVVQLYISDVAATVTRPVKELKGFKRVTIAPGQKQKVDFTLTQKELAFLGRDLKPVVEPGRFVVYVGTSSDGGLQSTFDVVTSIAAIRSARPPIENEPVDPPPATPVPTAAVNPEDDAFLEDLQKKTFQFFWDHSHPKTGLTLDRARTGGSPPPPGESHHKVASIAATGFALSGYCIAVDRGWVSADQAKERTRNTLDFLANRQEHKNGWFYHFVDQETGERRWRSELSSIDTALLLGGVLTVKNCFKDDREIVSLADKIYTRIDFRWMLNGDQYLLSHGWRPETGWIPNRWNDYSEQMMLYLMAIGSPTSPIPARSWYAWERTWKEFGQYRYLAAVSPLFIHQFSHAWVDFRNRRERLPPNVDYFENSVKATMAHRQFFVDVLSKDFPKYSANVWGLTASDSAKGYVAWGAPPRDPRTDGTVVPYAAAGSLMFTPDVSLPALKEMKRLYGDKVYGRYGFADAFNPQTGWTNPDVIGIDLGITLLSAENLRSGKVWYWFMQNDEIRRALRRVSLY